MMQHPGTDATFHPRFRAGFAILVGAQLALILAAIPGVLGAPLRILLGLAAVLPFLAAAAFRAPAALLLAAPLLVVFPVNFLRFYLYEWVAFSAIFSAFLVAAASARGGPRFSRPEWLWFLFAGWGVVTLSQAADLLAGVGGLSRMLAALLAFLGGYRVLGGGRARALARVMTGVSIAVAVQLVAMVLIRGYSLGTLATRVFALTDLGWGRSNYVAAVSALASAAALGLVLFGERRERGWGILGLGAALLVQVATQSRGGTVALLFGLVLAGALESRRRFLPMLLLVGGLVAAYLLSPLGQATLARFGPEGLPSIAVRLIFYRETLSIWRDHWLLGIGPDQLPYHTALYMDANPHNMFLKQMVDHGVIGLLLYCGLLVQLLRRAARYRRFAVSREDRMLSLIFAVLLGVAILNAQYEPTLEGSVYGFLFWITAGSLARRAGDRGPVAGPGNG